MEVRNIENPPGSLVKIEFVNTGDEDFKALVEQWIQENYPEMDHKEFFDRLEEFVHGRCVINMRNA